MPWRINFELHFTFSMEDKTGKTIFVRNLPYNTTNDKFESIFGDIGPIKKCFVVKDKDSDTHCRGFGYVTYSVKEDAEKAVQKIKSFENRKVFIHFADKKPKKKRKSKLEEPDDENEEKEKDEKEKEEKKKINKYPPKKQMDPETKKKHITACTVVVKNIDPERFEDDICPVLTSEKNQRDVQYPVVGRPGDVALVIYKSKKDAMKGAKRLNKTTVKGSHLSAMLLLVEQRAMERQKSAAKTAPIITTTKKCRLIVRNLSFQSTEDALKGIFGKFGEITEVKIPTKPDGKMLGFGFVQYSTMAEANAALQQMNAKPILGRPVAVDWAVPKNKFEELSKKIKDEPENSADSGSYSSEGEDKDAELSEDMESNDSDEEKSDTSVEGSSSDEEEDSEKQLHSSDEDSDSDMDEGIDVKKRGDDGADNTDDDSMDDDDDADSMDDDGGDDSDSEDEKTKRRKLSQKSDVDQGKTLFIRNISYDTEEDALNEALTQFGDVKYCRVVIDPDTEHSRGTAFVQYKQKEGADKALAAASNKENPLIVDGRKLTVVMAVTRETADKIQANKKKKEPKDNRNLYLAREGLIRPGTQAAVGLSSVDINKRMKLEATKRAKLKNPNTFISDTRLSIHNIPTSVDDRKLKQVFLKAVNDKAARITECRIMRDMQRVNTKGVAKSKGFGFIDFSDHKYSLQALRIVNNNPDLFGDKRRLIVEFSIENRAALVAKEKRIERAKVKQDTLLKGKSTFTDVKIKKRKSREDRTQLSTEPSSIITSNQDDEPPKKGPKGLPTHWGPKDRHRNRGKDLKPARKPKDKRTRKEALEEKQKRMAENQRQKPKKAKKRPRKEIRDNLDNLVKKYTQQFSDAYKKGKTSTGNKSKWFDS